MVGLVLVCALVSRARDPERLDPKLSFLGPTLSHPLGCGEAGVDLLALVSHALLRGAGLAVLVAVVGLVIGAPVGAIAALRRGALERFTDRACDLVQSFPSFLLALAVLSAGPPRDLVAALAAGDAARFQAVPGIGKRTAERLIVELREKVGGSVPEQAISIARLDGPRALAREGLIGLGYSVPEADELLDAAVGERPEDLIASALRTARQ